MGRTYASFGALALAALVVGSTGCSGIEAHSDAKPGINFSGYRSFAFISEHPMLASNVENPLIEGHIMNSIKGDLQRKGLTYKDDPETADVAIAFTVGSREKLQVDSYPVSYRAGYGSWGRYGGYYGGVGYGTETRVREITKGELAIDVFDVSLRQPVWHGQANKTISSSDAKDITGTVDKIVVATLKDFPPGRG